MQGYSKLGVVPSITVHYNGKFEASMQDYSKGSVGPSIAVYYIILL
jgi:hypothetical protein